MGKRIILFILLCSFFIGISAQNAKLYDAYISNQMDIWKTEMDRMEQDYLTEKNIDNLFDLTLAQYGYIAYCMSMDQKKMATDYVEKAKQNAETMLEYDSKWARAHATRGAIYGFEAGQAPYKGIVLGTRAIREVEEAMVLDPVNPYIWMEKGNIDLYKPTIFGGNKHDAIKFYLKAIELFEQDPGLTEKNWLYLNTLNGLARAYVKTDRIKKANRTYLKILELEPDFQWIRNDVYPKFLEKYF
ncbi:tetratricopeptide repeat protein [Bacteroidota bacterium]